MLSAITQWLGGRKWPSGPADRLFETVRDVVARIPVDFGGGCPPMKAYALAWLIRAERIKTSVDIGVYRGRSLMPQAVAHRDFTGGVAYGIDPYSKDEAVQHDNRLLKVRLDEFVRDTDFDRLYLDVLSLRETLDVEPHCRLIRKTSAAAAADFAARRIRFGLVHIDGNHDTARVLEDVRLYLPLVEPGGLVVLDDVSWRSVKPAFDAVASQTDLLFIEKAPMETELDFAVFRRGGSPRSTGILRESLRVLREGFPGLRPPPK
jgi:predicted O-methyltransferase YrrM